MYNTSHATPKGAHSMSNKMADLLKVFRELISLKVRYSFSVYNTTRSKIYIWK
jgi:hypothetical protein